MIYSLILLPFFIYGVIHLHNKLIPIKQDKFLKILTLVFLVVFFFRLFSIDSFEYIANAVGIIPNRFLRICFIIWRAITQGAVLIVLVGPFFKNKHYNFILSYFIPLISIINLVIIKQNVISFVGIEQFSFNHYRSIQFILETSLMLMISSPYLYSEIKRIKKDGFCCFGKSLKQASLVFFGVVLLVLPLSTFQGLFGLIGSEAEGFVPLHRILIYITFLIPLVLYFYFRNKPYESRYALLVTISIAGFMTYFSSYSFRSFLSVSSWPLHLCNTAIILMMIAFVFRSKTFFYFNYFINVIGALAAIILPNTSGDFFLNGNIHFWYNHMYAFFLPLLGVALKIFPRPNFKMIGMSIGVFSAYFVLVALINSWFKNYDAGVNYFFLNDDFLARKISFLRSLREMSYLNFQIKGLTFELYPWYWVGIYVGFIILTFLTWLVYDALYHVSDAHYDLMVRKKRLKILRKELPKPNIQKEVKKMTNAKSNIKITNFSKIYGRSTVKAVDNFNLEINEGEIFGFLGHNGAGKSTVIKSLVGIQSITEGSISVCGYDIQKEPLQAKLMIGYVPDNHAVYERLTGREYVNYIADLFLVSTEERKIRLEKYIKMFNLEEAIDREIKTYSHGMKQKITVIAALIHDPKVWVLDEPLTGLDPTSSYQIKECMKEHAKAGNIVFFSSHVIEVVENICDRIAVIKKGKLVALENVLELKAKGISLESIYLQHVGEHDMVLKNVS